ncbi:MAG: hypothetical protein HRT43_05215, partial [Campylobacteraceae bacterium]|nr:hypothetical protein [Campylobacteraceae bacterium]
KKKYSIAVNESNGNVTPFFIAFHYAFYPHLLTQIMEEHNFKSIKFLIHEHNNDIGALEQLCKMYGSNVEFVPIDEKGRFLRKLLKAKKTGSAIFMLVDLPVRSESSKVNQVDIFDSGSMKVIDGFMRIAKLLSTQPTLIYHEQTQNNDGLLVSHEVVESTEQVFNVFERLVIKAPYLWERLNDLHSFYDSNAIVNQSIVSFKSTRRGEYFLYSSENNKTYTINSNLFDEIKNYKGVAQSDTLKSSLQEKFKVNHVL